MHLTDDEFVNPYNEADLQFWMKIEHLARYLYAAWLFERRGVGGLHIDVGCGNGYGIEAMAKAQPKRRYMGVDYDAALLAHAPQPLATWQHLDLDKDTLKLSEKAASVTVFETLEHLNNPEDFLHNLHRQMKAGGWLLVSLPNPKFEKMDTDGVPVSQHHHHAFSREAAEALLQGCGFTVVETLGQSITNRLFSRERNLVSGGVIKTPPFAHPVLQTPQMIEDLANLLAWPFAEQLEATYSYLYICRRAATGGGA